MTNKLICSLIAISAINLYGQKLEKGPEHTLTLSRIMPYVVGEDENQLYVADIDWGAYHGYDSPYIVLQSYNKSTLSNTFDVEHKLEINSGMLRIDKLERFLFAYPYHIVFISTADFKTKTSQLKAYRYSAKTGEKLPEVVIHELDINKMRAFTASDTHEDMIGKYNINVSKNKKKVLVHFHSYDLERKVFKETLTVYDTDFNVLLEKEFTRKSEDDLIAKDKIIDDEGSIYYMSGGDLVYLDFFKDYEEWREKIPTDKFESSAKAVKISGSFNPQGNLIITAGYLTEDLEDKDENKFYEEEQEGDTQLEGMIYMEVDGFNKEIKFMEISRFTPELIASFRTKEMIRDKRNTEINDIFDRVEYHFYKDKTILVLEDAFASGTGVRHGSLLIMTFDTDGKMMWAHRLGKNQLGGPKNLSAGHFPFIKDNIFYILILDEERNYKGHHREDLEFDEIANDKYAFPVLFEYDILSGERQLSVKQDWMIGKYYPLIPDTGYQKENDSPAYIFYKDGKSVRLAEISTGSSEKTDSKPLKKR